MRGFIAALLAIAFLSGAIPSAAADLAGDAQALRDQLSSMPDNRTYRTRRADLLTQLGLIETQRRHYETARQIFNQTLTLNRKAHNRSAQGYSEAYLGDVERYTANYTESYRHYVEALEHFDKARDKQGRAETLWRFGELYRYQRQNQLAQNTLFEARDLFRQLGFVDGEGKAVMSLAKISHIGGNFEKAYTLYNEAAGLFGEAHDLGGAGEAFQLAGNAILGNDPERAWKAYRLSLDAYRTGGFAAEEADTLMNLAKAEMTLFKDADAEQSFLKAQALYRSLGDNEGEGDALRGLGGLARAIGDNDMALARFGDALEIYRLGAPAEKMGALLQNLGDLERQFGRPDEARTYYSEALKIYQGGDNVLGQANILLGLGLVESGPDPDLALEHFANSAKLYQAVGMTGASNMALEAARRLQADIAN